MANYEATRYDWDGVYLTGVQGVNTGIIVPWGSASIPSGFLECNGAAVSRSTYAALFAVVGTAYGSGNGSTTFNVPDLQDKTVLSKSNTKALASTGGANTVSQTGNIGGSAASTTITTNEMPSHSHTGATGGGPRGTGNQGTRRTIYTTTSAATGGGGGHTHNLSLNFSGGSKSVLQPFLTLIYIIKN